MYNVVYACLWLAQIHSSTCLLSELIYVAILLQVWKRFVQFEHTYGDLSSMLKVWALFIGFVSLGKVRVNMTGLFMLKVVTGHCAMKYGLLLEVRTCGPYLWFECATPVAPYSIIFVSFPVMDYIRSLKPYCPFIVYETVLAGRIANIKSRCMVALCSFLYFVQPIIRSIACLLLSSMCAILLSQYHLHFLLSIFQCSLLSPNLLF